MDTNGSDLSNPNLEPSLLRAAIIAKIIEEVFKLKSVIAEVAGFPVVVPLEQP